MTQPEQTELVTVLIDGQEVAVPKGTNLIEAARLLNVDIPHFCYHSKLSIAGNCRMCLVEMGMPAVDRATREPIMDEKTGKQKINWIPRPVIGCGTAVAPGMQVKTRSQMAKDSQEGVMEFLLINHPLDCPTCDQAGECKLQEQATGYGRGYSRFIEDKVVKPKRTLIGPRVMLDDERCILCSRCIRFCKEIAKDDVLGFVDRGSYSTLTCYPNRKLENNYSLNTVDICPVGALTSTDFRFKMRTWFLERSNSICTESSVGANTIVWSREGTVHRITPRRNDAVNDTWMADSGRLLYKQVAATDRLNRITIDGTESTLDMALNTIAGLVRSGKVAIVGSGQSSVEEQYLTRQLATKLSASVSLVSRVGDGDGILISADRNPNVRGALVTGLIDTLPEATLTDLSSAIDAGELETILSMGEDLTAAGIDEERLAKVNLVYLGTHQNATSTAAKVVLPTLSVFEKSGSFVNQQFRLQKFQQAVPGLAGAVNDLVLLTRLLAAIGADIPALELGALWQSLAVDVPLLSGLSWAAICEEGVQLDGSDFERLVFVEGETLHYQTATAGATA